MTSVTIDVDDSVIRRARIRAEEQGTSVNAVLQNYLQRYAGSQETATAISAFLRLAQESEPVGKTTTGQDSITGHIALGGVPLDIIPEPLPQ